MKILRVPDRHVTVQKFPASCPNCKEIIPRGARVVWYKIKHGLIGKGTKPVHEDCDRGYLDATRTVASAAARRRLA